MLLVGLINYKHVTVLRIEGVKRKSVKGHAKLRSQRIRGGNEFSSVDDLEKCGSLMTRDNRYYGGHGG